MAKPQAVPDNFISVDPEDAEVSTGLLNDVDVTITSVNYEKWTYPNKEVQAAAFHMDIQVEGADEIIPEYIPCGSLDRMTPSDDGERLFPVEGSSAKGLSPKSAGYAFFASLKNCGFPMEKLRQGVSVMVGMKCHILRVPAPKEGGVTPERKRADGKTFEKTLLTISEIHSFPWDDQKVKGRAPAKAPAQTQAQTQANAKSEPDTDLTAEAQEIVTKLLGQSKYRKGIPAIDLYSVFFQEVKTNPQRKALLQVIQEDDFLADGPFQVNGKGDDAVILPE